ncbi:Uncharacterised protein [Mobiluncus curtisii]|uniref:Uncharacterized protein n=2 Tax=Mobiluncus curtisii TaxID=2051 RepID=A0A2X3BQX2_9ACTO|nr:Uncharacterised protein [Mobiluncus curtisii]
MESIRDPEHARQVLARIVAIPRWIRWVISLFGGVCGAAVSALNAFLSLLAFTVLMSIVLLFTYSFASRIGSGRFYDPTGYKVIWLGSFMPIGCCPPLSWRARWWDSPGWLLLPLLSQRFAVSSGRLGFKAPGAPSAIL